MNPKVRQRGAIFLALVLILVVLGSTATLSALNNRQGAYLSQQNELSRQMEIAKSNLLAYLVNSHVFYADASDSDDRQGPGFFPCPDTDDPATDPDGLPNSPCNPTNTTMPACNGNTSRPAPRVGRLPRYVDANGYRFAISDYYDDPHQQFWYVVAPRYVYHTNTTSGTRFARHRTSTSTTVSTPGPACMRMYLDDAPGYVALIIAPGEELDTQDRVDNPAQYAHYLDGLNGGTNYYYYTSYESNPVAFNDRIIGITLEEYIKAVGMRVAIEEKKEIDAYYEQPGFGYYPGSQSNFRNELNDTSTPEDHVWLLPNTATGYNGERWSTNTLYSRLSTDTARIYFNGCTGITFTLTYGAGITASGDSC